MSDPMRIRAQATGDKVTVRVLMAHEMETGQRKDSSGKVIPAWFIQEVTATQNGKVGDKIVISWIDNKGDKRSDEAAVT